MTTRGKWKMESAASRTSAYVIGIILLIPVLILAEGSDEPTRQMIDLAVEDIWYDEHLMVHCRVASLDAPYTGTFYVNLTVDGHPYFSDAQIMMDWTGVHNVTFQQTISWEGEKVEVMVNVYDPQWPGDGDPGNDERTEVWERDLPNLRVISVFSSPISGGTTAVVQNAGFETAALPFNVSLYLNGSFETREMVTNELGPWEQFEVDLDWVWNPERSPVNINVTVDLEDDVTEFDEDDNTYLITWERRPEFYFVQDPDARNVGRTNATIFGTTTIPAAFRIEYGTDHTLSNSFNAPGSSAQVETGLDQLDPGTQYLCRVVAEDIYGRTIESDVFTFITAPPEGQSEPTVDFSGDLEFEWTDEIDIPIDIGDDVGVNKVDVYIEGRLYKSFGGLGKKSMSKLTLGKPVDMQHLATNWDAMRVTVRVTDDEGSETGFEMPPLRVIKKFEVPYPRITWYPNTERTYDGTEMLMARCEDPGGMANATWIVNGLVWEIEEARHPDASYFGPWTVWDTTSFPDGYHEVTIEVRNNEGNVSRVTRTLEVDNILPPASPDIWVRRANIGRDGTVCTVRLNVTNHGRGDALNVVVVDRIKGFVPIDGEEGTHPIFGNGKEWEVFLTTPRVRPGQTVWLEYRAIPILYNSEEWVLGYEVPRPDVPTLTYTTRYTYDRSDELVHYSGHTWIPPTNFQDGYIMEAGARQALLSSNYLMITNPVLLLRNFVFGAGYFDMMSECGELLALKNGVFGFIDIRMGISPTPDRILDTLIDWKEYLHPEFEDRGYLAILGEDEIIPTWSYTDVVWDNDVYGSDHGYTNLNGGNTPKLVVGRIIGNTPERMLEPIRAATGVASGVYRNDNDGNAVIMSGGGGGVRSFQGSAEDIYWLIEDEMRGVSLNHISNFLPIEDGSIEFDGKSRHMAAGDLDGDGSGEVVILDPAEDLVHIFHPDTGARSNFALEMTDRAVVQAGWLNYFDRKMMAIFDDFPDGDEYKCMEMDGTIHWSRRTWLDIDDPICLMDYDAGDFQDNIVRGDVGTNTIHIYDFRLNEITSFTAADIRTNHRIDSADMDDDGDMDIIVADHHSDKIRVYRNPAWERVDIPVSGLDYADGFGAGNFIYQRVGSRGEAVVVHSNDGYLQPCWLEWDDTASEWVGKSEKVFITPASADCAVDVTSMQGEGGYEEIVLSIGGWADRTIVMDYRNVTVNYRNRMSGIVTNKDLLVYRDHGNQKAWSGLFGSSDIDSMSFRYTHRPVVIGLVCQSGRFHDAVDSFAQAVLRSGAGVYIGSTQNSYRSSNNNAIEFIEDYVEGTPIGIAFRNIERKMVAHASDLGLSGGEGRYWAYEYNFYGDPAFGTDGRPWPGAGSRSTGPELTRSTNDIEIDIPMFYMINDTGGQRAWIEGGSEVHIIGEPVVPFITREVPLHGETVRSVELEMTGDWTYHAGLKIPDFEGHIIDGAHLPVPGSEQARGDTRSAYDPLAGYFPEKTMEWEVRGSAGGRSLIVRIFPFQHDGYSGISRFCSEWTIHMNTTTAPVEVLGWEGPGEVLHPTDTAVFVSSIRPLGEGGEIAISQRIERSGGERIDTLPSSVLSVNITTEFEGEWDTGGHAGPFVYVMELRTPEGAYISSLQIPFNVKDTKVSISSLIVEPDMFTDSTIINASMTLSNEGSDDLEGWYSLSLLDNMSRIIQEKNGTVNIGPSSGKELKSEFDMSGLECDIYGIRGTFMSGSVILSDSAIVIREDTVPPVPRTYEAFLHFEHEENITEEDTLIVIGNVTRSDGLAIPGLPVAVWLGERNASGSALTDDNGSFVIEIGNLTAGAWQLWITTVFGEQEVLDSSDLMIDAVPVGDDDDVDDDITDDDIVDDDTTDDDIVDDDTTDDDIVDDDTGDDDTEDDDDEPSSNWGLIAGISIAVIFLLLIVLFIVVMVRRSQEEEMDWDEE